MRRLIALFSVFALAVVGLVAAPAAQAATYREVVAQDPQSPREGESVRVWMDSDTAPGETAGLEYRVDGDYAKVLGSYDTAGPDGANWYADIPSQGVGSVVDYQLFTRNEGGQDYGFTDFGWSYTVASPGDIHWDGLKHDSFDALYRSPFGAVETGTEVTLRFRTEPLNADRVDVVIYEYDSGTGTTKPAQSVPMSYVEDREEDGTNYAIWQSVITAPDSPSILYYKFKVTAGADVDWYSDSFVDGHDNLGQGGLGEAADEEPEDSYQLTVHADDFTTPQWLQDATVYQIFPDRFRNGDPTNDYCVEGSTTGCPTFYGDQEALPHTIWNEQVGDAREVGGEWEGEYGTQFFGGDLQGITEKLDYLQGVGVDTLYLTPIFTGSSNHRYDTDNYLEVDPALGGNEAYDELVAQLDARGMNLILDGVFNHTSSDSLYFDRYGRYDTDGACESLTSDYRAWFSFTSDTVPCGSGDYEGWFGYDSLSVLADGSDAVRDFIYRSEDSVTQTWYEAGIDGWRFDVADEISHDWWKDYRGYAKEDAPEGPWSVRSGTTPAPSCSVTSSTRS